ncbi:hypothetical protein B0H13DRAFT_2663112 [Mycena leptocephala]|nr:hypothetical protein B0H13DRAFT_2663112 [Mycena leptocephala]
MENGAPPPENDMLARLRAEEFRSLSLEAELAVLRLKLVHDGEDLVAARSRCSKYKARWEHTERELTEVRAKYEGLKRKLAPKRKHEPDIDDAGERREHNSFALSCGEDSPVEEFNPSTNKTPDPNSKLGDPIVRKVSVSSVDERDSVWPKSPIITTASPIHAIPSSNSADRTSDPRKRMKVDTSPDLRTSSTPSIAPPSPSITPASVPARRPPPFTAHTPNPCPRTKFPSTPHFTPAINVTAKNSTSPVSSSHIKDPARQQNENQRPPREKVPHPLVR